MDKISRKDLKKPDEFFSLTKRIAAWLIEQRVALLGGAAVLAVVIVAVFGWQWYGESREKEASRLFMEARQITQKNSAGENNDANPGVDNLKSEEEKYRAAISGFEKVSKKFSKTDTAALAIFYIGQYYQKLGDLDKAIESYKEYLAREGVGGELASAAVEGIATSFESKQMIGQAIENYKRLCEEPTLETECDRGMYHLARLNQEAGKLQEAADQFRSIIDKYPNTQFSKDIQERLIMLPKPAVKSAEALTRAGQPGQPSLDTNKKEQ